MDKKYIVALQLSGSQIKGAVASLGTSPHADKPAIAIEAIVSEEKVSCVQYGRVKNLIEAVRHTEQVLSNLTCLDKFRGCNISAVYVALEGRSFASSQAQASIRLSRETVIGNEELRHLDQAVAKQVPIDRQLVKIVPRRFKVDNNPIANPHGALGTTVQGDFTIVTCSPINRRNLDMIFGAEHLNLPVKEYVVVPLAIAEMSLSEEDKQIGCVLVDFGAYTTTVSIYKDRALQYLATVPLGSYHITRDLATSLNYTEEQAERIKLTKGNACPGQSQTADEAKFNNLVTARVGEIVANVLAQIDYAGLKASDLAAGFVIAGRGAKLRNFSKYLEEQSKMKVRAAQVPGNIIADGSVLCPTDFLPVIAVINHAAKHAGAEDLKCVTPVEQPRKPVEPDIPINVAYGPTTRTVPVDDFDPFNVLDDDSVLDDNDVPQIRTTTKKPVIKDPEPVAPAATKPPKRPFFTTIMGKLEQILQDHSESEDTDLDQQLDQQDSQDQN